MNKIHLHTDDIADLSNNFIDRFGNKIMVNERMFGPNLCCGALTPMKINNQINILCTKKRAT